MDVEHSGRKLAFLVLAFITVFQVNAVQADESKSYKAYVHRCYDADTCDITIDLGFGLRLREKVRLARINAWEVTGQERPEGLKARDWLNDLISGEDIVVSKPFKKDRGKYGRILLDFHYRDVCLNDELVRKGHGKYQDY